MKAHDESNEEFNFKTNFLQANFIDNIIIQNNHSQNQYIIIDFADIFLYNEDKTVSPQFGNDKDKKLDLNVVRLQHPGYADNSNNYEIILGSKCKLFKITDVGIITYTDLIFLIISFIQIILI